MLSRMLGLGALLTAEVAAVVGVHMLGGLPWFALPAGDVGAWLATSAPEDVVMALLRLAALGCAYWLVLSTAGYALARASRVPAAVRGAQWVTLPVVRRIADRAVAVTMATSLVGASAPAALAGVGAASAAPAVASPAEKIVSEPDGRAPTEQIPPPLLSPESLPGRQPKPADGADRDPRPDRAEPPEGAVDVPEEDAGDAEAPAGGVHVVEPGDHLWGIAAADLADDSPRETPALHPDEVAPHWREVVADNREQLRSGDPDLIFPGERIDLPPDQE